MKTLLIITGPQGSGNHVFSKIFALHPEVHGWSELLDTYWIAHQHEPCAVYWRDPTLINKTTWKDGHYVTSISCPYALDGPTAIPKYKEVVEEFIKAGFNVKVAIIGRDQTILKYQQLRVRDTFSYPSFESQLEYLNTLDPVYISQELLYLYKEKYLETLAKQIGFPIEFNDKRVLEILAKDPNSKYFIEIESQELDKTVRSVSGLKEKKNEK